MSNVLIGIIGVILFIGLALAGALFLGPEFQRSTNNSRAAAVMQGASQVANAANLRSVQRGHDVLVTTTFAELLGEGFLKSQPANPSPNGGPFQFANGAGVPGGTGQAVLVVATVTGEVCRAIENQTSATPPGANGPLATDIPVTRLAGCSVLSDGPTAYVRI